MTNSKGRSTSPRPFFLSFFWYNYLMQWDKISDIILVSSLAVLAVFAVLGLFQLFSRKSLKKVDPELTWMMLPLALMAAVYYIFDHFLIWNTRPNGSGESSFPSTHVMVVSTIFLLVAIVLPRYARSKIALAVIDILMFGLTALVCIGRVAANMHWISDVVGGLVFAAIFAVVYYLIIRRYKNA